MSSEYWFSVLAKSVLDTLLRLAEKNLAANQPIHSCDSCVGSSELTLPFSFRKESETALVEHVRERRGRLAEH